MTVGHFEVGFAQTDITPEKNRRTIYDCNEETPDDRIPIRDRLFARATAFRGEGRVAVWTTLDVCLISSALRERVLVALAREGLRPDLLTLLATHTHTAPLGVPLHGTVRMPEENERRLERQTIAAIRNAITSLAPADLAFGTSSIDLSVNRREIGRVAHVNDIHSPTGLVDPEVNVAQIQREDGLTGLLFRYTGHPLAMTARVPQISADYPGRAIGRIRSEVDIAHAQFLQGCAGNVNVKITGDESELEQAGAILAKGVLDAASLAVPAGDGRLRCYEQVVRLPWCKIPSLSEARETLARYPAVPQSDYTATRMRAWAEAMVRTLEAGDVPTHADVLIQALRVGDAVFLALPGEVFVDIGLQIKEHASVEHLFVCAYANKGEVGYIPTAAAFPEGGYEVEVAPQCFGLFQLAPECERIMVNAGLDAVQRVTE